MDTGGVTSRLKDAISIYDIFKKCWDGDQASRSNRTMLNAMLDGEPPYDQEELKAMGQGDRTNLNFGTAFTVCEDAFAGYLDLVNSVDVLGRITTNYGDPADRYNFETILSEEWTRAMKGWSEFEVNHQNLAYEFIKHGVSAAVFEDDSDWRYDTFGLNNCIFPRRAPISPTRNEIFFVRKSYYIHEFYEFIKNPEAAAAVGWDVAAVENAIKEYATTQDSPIYDYSEAERRMKNNDLYYSYATSKEIRTIHAYYQERDGTVTHAILLEDAQGGGEHPMVYRHVSRFKSMENCLRLFAYGIGNRDIQSIRGLLYRIYPQIQVENRLRCSVVDATINASSMVLRVKDPSDIERLGMARYGPYLLLDSSVEVQDSHFRNNSAESLGVIRDLQMQIANNTGTYKTHQLTPENTERTKFEVQAQLAQTSILSQSAMNLFYVPWKGLFREVLRRMANPEYRVTDPGGREVHEFKKALLSRGCPLEALYQWKDIEPVRAIGYGSPGARINAIDGLTSMLPMLDEVGRANVIRDKVAAMVGTSNVSRYTPPEGVKERATLDAEVAKLENSSLQQGVQIAVLPGENSAVHISMHVPALAQTIQALQSGQVNPMQIVSAMQGLIPHIGMHLEQIKGDDSRKQMVGQVSKLLSDATNIFQKLQQQLSAKQQAEMEAAAKAQAQPSVQDQLAMAKEKAQIDATYAKIKNDQVKTQLHVAKTDQQLRDKDQRRTLTDLETASKIRKGEIVT